MIIYLVRHGQTDVNLAGLINARNDEDLNEAGIAQAKELGEKLKNVRYDRIVSSPSARAVHTAELLNAANRPIRTDGALLERDFGIYTKTPVSGLDRDDLWRMDPEKDYADAESVRSMTERVFRFLDCLYEEDPDGRIVLVTHGGVSKAVRAYFEGIPADGNLAVYRHENGEILQFEKSAPPAQGRGTLARSAAVKFLAGLLLLGLLLFLPAGTFAYPGAWLLLGILFVPMLLLGAVLLMKAPDRLRKRLSAREEQGEQKQVVALSGLLFLAAFVLAGLGVRFGWLPLPAAVRPAAAGVFLLGYAGYAETLRENAYLSRTVEIQQGQKVIDTGLYGIVRHPMYLATVLMFLSMPLVLGSLPGFAVMLGYLPVIRKRILNEEKVLEQGLAGYTAYEEKVKWRLVPLLW